MAKAAYWASSDTEARKRGERTGLDTPVVHAVNVVHYILLGMTPGWVKANAISEPPGDYGRKAKTQKN